MHHLFKYIWASTIFYNSKYKHPYQQKTSHLSTENKFNSKNKLFGKFVIRMLNRIRPKFPTTINCTNYSNKLSWLELFCNSIYVEMKSWNGQTDSNTSEIDKWWWVAPFYRLQLWIVKAFWQHITITGSKKYYNCTTLNSYSTTHSYLFIFIENFKRK